MYLFSMVAASQNQNQSSLICNLVSENLLLVIRSLVDGMSTCVIWPESEKRVNGLSRADRCIKKVRQKPDLKCFE